jgi:hypothetical protein
MSFRCRTRRAPSSFPAPASVPTQGVPRCTAVPSSAPAPCWRSAPPRSWAPAPTSPWRAPGPPPAPTGVRAGSGADLARILAAGLGDAEVRAAVHEALAGSALNEHKLVLQDFVRTPAGRRLVAASAARAGVAEAALVTWINSLPRSDFYVPVAEHRQSWAASQAVTVGYTSNQDLPLLTAFTAGGDAVQLDSRNGVPAQALILIHPAEPTWTRANAGAPARRGGVIEREPLAPQMTIINPDQCDPEYQVCDPDPTTGGTGNPGTYGVLTRVYPWEGDAWGDIELLLKLYNGNGGAEVYEYVRSGFNEREETLLFTGMPFGTPKSSTYVKAWERDVGFPETSTNDYWGGGTVAPTHTPLVLQVTCNSIHDDDFQLKEVICGGQEDVLMKTVELTFSY